jgi:uncharacterized protein YkwD
VKRCGGGEIFLNAKVKRTFVLQKASRSHSKDMIESDYFSHDTKGKNEHACERIRRFGYRWRECGETKGYNATPEAMFDAWMESSGHRANILSGRFRVVGIGAYTGDYRGFKITMYTVDFGAR